MYYATVNSSNVSQKSQIGSKTANFIDKDGYKSYHRSDFENDSGPSVRTYLIIEADPLNLRYGSDTAQKVIRIFIIRF